MGALAAKRRSLGLAASTIDIGVLYGIGYVNRVEGAKIYSNLRRQGYLPISEQDIHHMFAEAILAGRVDSGSSPQISTGLQRWDPTTDVPLPWHRDPRFSHHIVDSHDTPQMHIPGSSQTLKQVLDDSSTETEIIDSLQRAFATHLESMLHLPPGSVSPDASIIDLGVDSLVAVEIRSWFLKEVDKDVPVLKILGGSSIAKCESTFLSASNDESLLNG
jgi:acyl carrier protein